MQRRNLDTSHREKTRSINVSRLQQSVLSLDVYVGLFYSSLYSPRKCQACNRRLVLQIHICSTAANAVPRGVWPTAACTASLLSVCKSLCCTWACLFTRAFVLHLACLSTGYLCCTWDVSVYKNFVLHLDVSAYKSPAHAVTEGVRL